MDCTAISDTSSKRGDWNRLKVVHKIPEQHTGQHEIKEVQKTAIFGAEYRLGKVLM